MGHRGSCKPAGARSAFDDPQWSAFGRPHRGVKRAQAEGGLPGVGLHVDDCRKTYKELAAKGVVFIQEPQERPYGVNRVCATTRGTGWSWSSEGNLPKLTSRAVISTETDLDPVEPVPVRRERGGYEYQPSEARWAVMK